MRISVLVLGATICCVHIITVLITLTVTGTTIVKELDTPSRNMQNGAACSDPASRTTAPIEQSLHGLIITVALASVAAAVATMALVWSIRGNILEMSARAEALVSPPSPQHSPKSRKSSPRDSASTVVCVPHVATPSVIGEVDDLKLRIAAVGTVLQALTVFVPRGGKEGEKNFHVRV